MEPVIKTFAGVFFFIERFQIVPGPPLQIKHQPFPVLLCDGGMADIGNTLYKASEIDPGAFSVSVNVGALPAQEKKGAIVFKNQIFVLGEMAGVVDKSTA